MIVKVCGMREPRNVSEVASLGIDWMGFIFYERSPRFFNEETLSLPDSIKRVGVFVNENVQKILQTSEKFRLDYVQLHGTESVDTCKRVIETGRHIIKAISVSSAKDIECTERYEGLADYFLFDTKCKGYGGSGNRFDWSVLEQYTGDTPFLLSGGLRPDSLPELLQFHHEKYAGIDLNSGFEISPALKDTGKLKSFIEQYQSHFKQK